MVKRFAPPRSRQLLNKAIGYGPMYSFMEWDSWDVFGDIDDFHGQHVAGATSDGDAGNYILKTGDDSTFVILANETNGAVELSASTDAGGDTEYGMAFLDNLNFTGSRAAGMAIRLQPDAITTVRIETGFTDSVSADAMIAADASGAALTIGNGNDNSMNASDAAFWIFDTDGETEWRTGGVKAGAETTLGSPGFAPVAATYETLIVQLTDDMAEFIRLDANGKETYRGAIASAITAATKVTPFVAVQLLTGSIDRNLKIDYIAYWQRREANS